MNYQKLILVGNATADAEQRKSKKGAVSYTTFGISVSDGKDKTTFFPVTVFGKHGEAVAKYITKGRQILVEGRIAVGDNDRFNVIADSVRFGTEPKPTTKKKAKA
jgi:single-strand DNA-binding protein